MIVLPTLYWEQGWPQVNSAVWPGRGFAREVGTRAYNASLELGWPSSLDELERLLIAKGLVEP